jgi:proteasome lid subunit RPN8/RPN11
LASDLSVAPIRVPLPLWARMIFQLRRRSAGKRESGAFLLGPQNGAMLSVVEYICYDDLDPHAYQSGAIAFHAAGYAALWQYCRKKSLQVLADVHTHPSQSVGQSPIDKRNPMVPMVGHTALILPNFARTPWWSLRTAGVYEYLGDFTWRTYIASEKSHRIRLALW